MRREVPGRRIIFLMLVLMIIIVTFWQLAARRFSETGAPVADPVEVGPQTLSQMLTMGSPGVAAFYERSDSESEKLVAELGRVYGEYGAALFAVKVDVGKYPAEAAKYGCETVPALVYFDASGKKLAVAPGYRDSKAIARELKDLGLIK